MFRTSVAEAIAGAPTHAMLDALSKQIWQAYGAGVVGEGEAQSLSEMVEARRAVFKGGTRPPLVLASKPSLFARARLQRPPERAAAIERRRRLATSGPLPPALACKFTTGELAVLRIVADEVRDRDTCRRTYAEIAARAGVGRTTAQNAIRLAARLGLLSIEERRRPGHKSLPNVVRIISREWASWIARRPRGSQSIGFKNSGSTDTESRSKARSLDVTGVNRPGVPPEIAWRDRGRGAAPHNPGHRV